MFPFSVINEIIINFIKREKSCKSETREKRRRKRLSNFIFCDISSYIQICLYIRTYLYMRTFYLRFYLSFDCGKMKIECISALSMSLGYGPRQTKGAKKLRKSAGSLQLFVYDQRKENAICEK